MTDQDSKQLEPIQQAQNWIASYNKAFDDVVAECDVPVTFKREAGFALQILSTNEYTLKVALSNPDSLRHAILNAARTGITLDPSRRLAYLLPRDGRVIFEPSYMGMIAQATDTGAIKSADVSLVYSNDIWEYEERETGTHLLHRRPRLNQDRGELEGAYVRAVLPDGSTQIKVCTATYLEQCKAKNDAVKKGRYSAYTDWSEGMHEKAAVKLAAKFWPKVIGAKVIAATAFNGTGDPDHGGEMLEEREPKNVTPISETQHADLCHAMAAACDCADPSIINDECEALMEKIKAAFGIAMLGELPASRFDACMARIEEYGERRRVAAVTKAADAVNEREAKGDETEDGLPY